MKKIPYKTNQNHPVIKAYKDAVEKGNNNQHVVPKGNDWLVKRGGAERGTKIFNTQQEAAQYAKTIAKNQGTAVFIHGTDGRIRDRRDY